MGLFAGENLLFLAPMSGITDRSYRLLMREFGADIVISELLSAESIVQKQSRTIGMLRMLDEERPVGIQLFGGDAETMHKAAHIAIEQGADFVDINLGCPTPKVLKKNSGASLLRDPKALETFLTRINTGLTKPITVKMRTGWSTTELNAEQNIQAAINAGITLISIHGRTRDQKYEGQADWEYIKKLYTTNTTPIVGNGDIRNHKQALSLIKNEYSQHLMIGRGCLLNPLLFLQIKNALNAQNNHATLENIVERYIEITEKHVDAGYRDIKRAKVFHWFSLLFEDTCYFKEHIFNFKNNSQAMLTFVRQYFRGKSLSLNAAYTPTDFLLGGHG